jgi:hypothetical protein|tara:strand:+ start:16320 stop:16430 length:111 start_codon:yes stop_codon:yes gene_type:complete
MKIENRIEYIFRAFAASALTFYALGLLNLTFERYIA